jgi:hypothetical protein
MADKPGEFVKVNLPFEANLYAQIQTEAGIENRRQGFVKRQDKIHTYDMVQKLAAQGIEYRKGKVYVPEDKLKTFMKDDKFSKLLAKAQVANEELHAYMEKLLN